MWWFVDRCFRELELWCHRRNINRALGLYLRGEVRRDGLSADHLSCRLEIRWQAREVHPWDRECTRTEREALFAEQALADTEAAIHRLFEQLPYVDVIDLAVLEPTSGSRVAQGTVHRSTLKTTRPRLQSVGMRLRELGVTYSLATSNSRASDANDSAGELCAR